MGADAATEDHDVMGLCVAQLRHCEVWRAKADKRALVIMLVGTRVEDFPEATDHTDVLQVPESANPNCFLSW
jgi:hypothetical protein